MSVMIRTVASLRAGTSREAVAVLLNGNAKKVSTRVRRLYESLVPAQDLYWSRSLEEANRNVERIVDRGYGIVFTGGGDGTICHTINALHDTLDRRGPQRICPRIGILKLGTGNAMAHMVGAHAPVEHLLAAMRGEQEDTVTLELIEEGGRLVPFAGIGWDAAILNDYLDFKNRYQGRIGRRVFHSLLGYAAAIGMRTIPRELTRREPTNIRARNLGQAFHLLPDGRQLPIPKGTLLFDGPCKFAGVSTVPNYGFGLKVYPFAGTESGKMHLRISAMGVTETLRALPAIWRGEYRSPNLLDFLVDAVEIESEEPVPYQVGGDAMGLRQKLSFSVAPQAVELLDFRARTQA